MPSGNWRGALGGATSFIKSPQEIDQSYHLKERGCVRPCKVSGLNRTKVFHVKRFGTIGAAGKKPVLV
jgi:hypothetical protein